MALTLPAVAVKAVLTVATNKKTQKKIGWIFVAIFAPFIIFIALFLSLVSAVHDQLGFVADVADFVFDKITYTSASAEQAASIKDMQNAFLFIDNVIVQTNIADNKSLDSNWIKAIFYAMYYGEPDINTVNFTNFVACFYYSEQRPNQSNDGLDYTANIPIADNEIIYKNIFNATGKEVSNRAKIIATGVYEMQTGGVEMLPSIQPLVSETGFTEPIVNSLSYVTSEFGYRNNPVTGQYEFHPAIDISAARGTQIFASLSGIVTTTAYDDLYGYNILVQHDGGIVTKYSHCSKILVKTGQHVVAGETIGLVGTTGLSTGDHLDFQVIVDGTAVDPRLYLPTK